MICGTKEKNALKSAFGELKKMDDPDRPFKKRDCVQTVKSTLSRESFDKPLTQRVCKDLIENRSMTEETWIGNFCR